MRTGLKKHYYNLLKIKSRLFNGKPVLVVMYHRISNVFDDRLSNLTVTVEHFEEQLILYKQKFTILRTEGEWNVDKKVGVVVTFDDGYADNVINALPLLEKYEIPATIFISTLNIGTDREFWWDRLDYDYSKLGDTFLLPGNSEALTKKGFNYKSLSELINKRTAEDKEQWLTEFEHLNGIDFKPRPEYRSLSHEELKMLSEHPLISIGIHTQNHYPLGKLSYEDQKKEILYSIEQLRKLTDNYINYLAFPFGSYNNDSFKVLNELGIKGAFLANNNYTNNECKRNRRIDRIMIFNFPIAWIVDYLGTFQ